MEIINLMIITYSYQNSPDFRLTWLQHMAKNHNEVINLGHPHYT